MPKPKFLSLSWQEIHDFCFKLAQKIDDQNLSLDQIVAISRGGLIPARIFSDLLNLKISNFTIEAYTGIGKMRTPKVVEPLVGDIKGKIVLLVDEIVDSGATLKKAVDHLKEFAPKRIVSCVLVIKTWTKHLPDFWVLKTDKWLVFPYEVRETIEEVFKMMAKDGKPKSDITRQLLKLGFDQSQIHHYLTTSSPVSSSQHSGTISVGKS